MKPKSLMRQLVLPILLLLLCGGIFIYSPAKSYLFPQRLQSFDLFKDFYNEKQPYAVVETDFLFDSGYDYLVKGNIVGHYYYSLNDGYCQFYLLDKKQAGKLPTFAGGLTLRGRLVKMKEEEYENLIHQMADDLDWSRLKLSSVASPYVFSSLAFTNLVPVMVLAALLIGSLYSAADFTTTLIRYKNRKPPE